MVNQRKGEHVIGEHQGDAPPGADASVPSGGGVGQSGPEQNPDRPANQGVDNPIPGHEDDGRGKAV